MSLPCRLSGRLVHRGSRGVATDRCASRRCFSTTIEHTKLPSGGHVAHLRFAGEKKYPILHPSAIEKLTSEIQKLDGQQGLRALFFRSTIAGADIHFMKTVENANHAEAFIRSVDRLCTTIQEFKAPVIAVIDGPCMGAGMEVAASCDLRIAVDNPTTVFAMPETKIGIPSVVQASLLPGLVGWAKARELLYFGGNITAVEAQAIGFVNELTTPASLPVTISRWEKLVDEAEPQAVMAQKLLMKVRSSTTTDLVLPSLRTFRPGKKSAPVALASKPASNPSESLSRPRYPGKRWHNSSQRSELGKGPKCCQETLSLTCAQRWICPSIVTSIAICTKV